MSFLEGRFRWRKHSFAWAHSNLENPRTRLLTSGIPCQEVGLTLSWNHNPVWLDLRVKHHLQPYSTQLMGILAVHLETRNAGFVVIMLYTKRPSDMQKAHTAILSFRLYRLFCYITLPPPLWLLLASWKASYPLFQKFFVILMILMIPSPLAPCNQKGEKARREHKCLK